MRTLLLLLLQLAASFAITNAASVIIKEGIAGQVCFVQPIPFASKSFSYTISIDPALTQLPEGCSASQILLSALYTSGSCLNPSDNSKSGCPSSDGTVITGTSSSAGTRVSLNATTPLCNQAFEDGQVFSPLEGATTYARGTVTCGPSSTGYLYFQNNCPATAGNQSAFQIRVDYTVSYPTCSGSGGSNLGYYDYYSNDSWGTWPMILGICIAVFVIVFILLTICGKRRRQQQLQQQQQGGVQMMPPPPPPGGMAYGMPYGGGPPPGYPIPPPQPPSNSNFIPPPSGAPSSAYPSQPTMNIGGISHQQPTSSSQYPTPEGVAQPAIWYAGGKPPS